MNRIAEIRARLDVTQAALAHALGVTQGNVSFYEHGRTMPVRVAEKLIAYCAVEGWHLTLDQVYGRVALPRRKAR